MRRDIYLAIASFLFWTAFAAAGLGLELTDITDALVGYGLLLVAGILWLITFWFLIKAYKAARKGKLSKRTRKPRRLGYVQFVRSSPIVGFQMEIFLRIIEGLLKPVLQDIDSEAESTEALDSDFRNVKKQYKKRANKIKLRVGVATKPIKRPAHLSLEHHDGIREIPSRKD